MSKDPPSPTAFTGGELQMSGADARRVLPLCGVGVIAAALLIALGSRGSLSGGDRAILIGGVVLLIASVVGFRGMVMVASGQSVVLQLFGRYMGTIRTPGLRWVHPWCKRRTVSLKIRTHETAVTKVNDSEGNPIELSVIVTWHVVDTARALFAVEDYVRFVGTQCEVAVRHLAASYRYDPRGEDALSLSSGADVIVDRLRDEIAQRVEAAGINVIESRIVRIAYAPEIAQVMLRRQQAGAIVAARQQIVDGAVGMVELALHRLDEENVVELDEERKAAMVSNLLVVLCSDHSTQPIVNAGSLYH